MAGNIPNLDTGFQPVRQNSSHEPMDISPDDVLQNVNVRLHEPNEIIYSDEHTLAEFVTAIVSAKPFPNRRLILPSGVILAPFQRYISLSLPSGNLYERYDVNDDVRRGAFGAVQIYTLRTNRDISFARKRVDLSEDLKSSKSMEREVNAMLELKYFHVIKFYGLIQINISVVDVLLEAWGMSIATYLSSNVIPPSDIVCYWFYQVLLGVMYMHSKQLVHCDIHLGNILIKNNKIKICDFGSTKKEGELLFTASHGHTRRYFPPTALKCYHKNEQINVSCRLDSFAVGKLLLEVIRGGDPISEESMLQHISEKTSWDKFVLSNIPPHTHKNVRDVITGLMSFTTADGITTEEAAEKLDSHIAYLKRM